MDLNTYIARKKGAKSLRKYIKVVAYRRLANDTIKRGMQKYLLLSDNLKSDDSDLDCSSHYKHSELLWDFPERKVFWGAETGPTIGVAIDD